MIASLEPELKVLNIKEGISLGLDQLAQPYDNWEIFRILLRIVFKKGKRERNRNYICSELIRDIYINSGIVKQLNNNYISPDNIWKLARADFKYRIL